MNKDTIKKRILQKLDWNAPKELYEWKCGIIILKECGYQYESFSLDKGYKYRDAQSAMREIAQERVDGERVKVKMYLVPPLKKGANYNETRSCSSN